MLAYDFPVLGLFFSMFWFFLWVLWLFLVFRIVIDIFRSDDMGGFAKVLWLLLVFVLPYLGAFAYVIVRGAGMSRRDRERELAADASFREYVRDAAGPAGGSSADELAKLAELRDRGVLSEDEFTAQKARLLA